jgi:DNA topoisomerase-1
MKLLIVESPAKSKTINGYLGKDFKVLASFGHIMELPSKDGSVDPLNNFEMNYQFSEKSTRAVKEIVEAAMHSSEIYLATDPDREGEAISASILEALRRKKVPLSGKKIFRVAFNQITKTAVLDAIKNPRTLDENLVDAQKARLSLDYLVGFNVSPVLWRKLPGSRSAGRVQSVALRIVCEREGEVESFLKEEYWTIDAQFQTAKGEIVKAVLEHFDGKKLQKFDINTKEKADSVLEKVRKSKFNVVDIISKETRRKPYAPFMTSTLQQDASGKLGFSPKKTMLLAQKLYEGFPINGETKGLITYMRTDSPTISKEGIEDIRKYISSELGEKYETSKPNIYTSKAKNSQEAHEAIRPVDSFLTPNDVKSILESDELKLYTLIWKRAIASQMADAVFESTKVEITSPEGWVSFKANGSVLTFEGYQKIYNYSESEDSLLPKLKKDEMLNLEEVLGNQHFTSPPPRYTEASLVKRLEELGIGRPSTYASTLAVLQDREYVKLEDKKLVPEERGRIVTAFLESFFSKYVEYDFTAKLEEELDLISNGELGRVKFLDAFWKGFDETVKLSEVKSPVEVSMAIETKLEKLFFKETSHECLLCKKGKMHVKIGKFGPFLACDNYPECKNIINPNSVSYEKSEDKLLGTNDKGLEIFLKKGPYGFYVELADGSKKPKRASLAKTADPELFSLEEALGLLVFPRVIGEHPEGGDVIAGVGPYGPYVAYNKKYHRLPSKDLAADIGLEEALEIINKAPKAASKAPYASKTEVKPEKAVAKTTTKAAVKAVVKSATKTVKKSSEEKTEVAKKPKASTVKAKAVKKTITKTKKT